MDIKPSHYIIGIIVFTAFIVGGVSMLSIFREADPTFIDDTRFNQFNETFNVYEDVDEKVGELEEGIQGADTDFGLFGVLNSLINSAWQTLKLTMTSFGFMSSVFGGLYGVFAIPAWAGALILLAVSVMFVFAIFSAIFQREL